MMPQLEQTVVGDTVMKLVWKLMALTSETAKILVAIDEHHG
jgi:hypothetical protein